MPGDNALLRGEAARAKTADELVDQLTDLKKEQFNLRFQRATGQLENTARVRKVRKDIAVIKTVLGARRLAETRKGAGEDEAKNAQA